jgi:hypothetical protein
MDITSTDDLLDSITSIINYISDNLVEQDCDFYIALEIAHQLRDEVANVIPED